MQKIYKYHLNIQQIQTLRLPYCAQVLTVQLQDNLPELWALVNPNEENPEEERDFEIFATGQEILSSFDLTERKYISTFQTKEGLVFHVFERINKTMG